MLDPNDGTTCYKFQDDNDILQELLLPEPGHWTLLSYLLPDVPVIQARKHTGITECINTASMAERKAKISWMPWQQNII